MDKRPHFHLARVPVRVEPFFFAVMLLLGFQYVVIDPVLVVTWVAIGTVSILLHEMGHAVAFRAFGIQPRVVLHGFGGLTAGEGELTPARSIVVSLAGPMSALLLLGLPALALEEAGAFPRGLGPEILSQMVFINVGWSLLNLVPVLPLDGGNVVASVIDLVAPGRGTRVAQVLSVVVAGTAAAWLLTAGERYLFLAFFAGIFAVLNIAALARPVEGAESDGLADAHRALVAGHPELAAARARQVLAGRPSPTEAQWATELLAWSHLLSGDSATAQSVAASLPEHHPASRTLQGALALAGGRRAEGVAVVAWSFVHEAAGPQHLLAAIATAQAGAVPALVDELVLLGPSGVQAAGVLGQLLAYAGFGAEAGLVAARTEGPPPTAPTATTAPSGPVPAHGAPPPVPPDRPMAASGPPAAGGAPPPVPGSSAPGAAWGPEQGWSATPPAAPPSAWPRRPT